MRTKNKFTLPLPFDADNPFGRRKATRQLEHLRSDEA